VESLPAVHTGLEGDLQSPRELPGRHRNPYGITELARAPARRHQLEARHGLKGAQLIQETDRHRAARFRTNEDDKVRHPHYPHRLVPHP